MASHIRPTLSTARGDPIYVQSAIKSSFSHLDVLYANAFEGKSTDRKVAEQLEENFYRGAPPEWLNFHIVEQAVSQGTGTPFVKRDGYDELVGQIQNQRKRVPRTSFVKLLHQPGSGGTTLAMQVLWDLRKTFRCAALTGPTSDLKAIANEVICLFTASRRGNQNTVLLLLNDEQIVDSLQDSIRSEIARHNITTFAPVVVLLIHVRKAEIEECEHVILKKELSDREKQEFEDKKKELSRRYRDRHKHFHGFNVMQTNFSQAYVKEACAVLKPVKKTRKSQETQLATFLSLMNAYVPGSYLLESQCLAFLNDKDSIHGGLSLEDRMKPFGNLVITLPADMNSDRKVCMAHHMIAQQCTELLAEAGVTRSDTTRNFMSCLFNKEVSKCLLGFVKDMLTKRETLTEQEQEKFSRLILDIQKKEGNVQSASVLKVASRKFVKNPFFPQTLARFYYSEIKDYNQAEIWVYKAIDRDPKNSFIADTLGQVHKHHLNSKTWSKSPGNPREILQLATKAFEAFKNEERLAENVANTFNNRGMFGFLQVASTVYDALVKCNKDWKDVLTQTVSMGSVLKSLGDNKLYKFNDLISSLRDEVERKCKFFDIYLTYSKFSMKKDDRPYIWREVSSCYQKYVGNSPPKHLKHADNLPPGLKENMDGTLSLSQVYFILSQLTISQLTEISARTEEINSTEQATINYIAANITLQNMVQGLLSKCDRNMLIRKMPLSTNDAPECHMLALLMLWKQDSGEDSLFDLNRCIQVMHSSYENAYKKYLRSRYLRPLVFLGEGRDQSRIVHRSVLDEFFLVENKDATFEDLKKQWTNDGIFKNLRVQNRLLKLRGVVRNYRVYAACGDKEIEVNANLQDNLWKSGQVSFYLGFNIRGPVAFCIQRIDDKPTSEGHAGSCTSCDGAKDSSDWTKVKPEVITTDGVPTYRLQSTAGRFECSVSALRWVCHKNVSFKYQFGSWDKPMERLAEYRPAGPLIDLKVTSGKLREVHLPQWICLDHSPDISESLAVLHVDSDGVSVERVSEVTQCHIRLFKPVFSPRGVLMRHGAKVKVRCDVLIYKTNKAHLTLHVYLIPRDAAVLQAMEQKELCNGYQKIKKPNPDTYLKMRDHFVLTTDGATAEICPERLKLRYETVSPNFFEVFNKNPNSDFRLTLENEQKKNKGNDATWTCVIRKDDYQNNICNQGKHFVDQHRTALIERVSNPMVILDKLLDKTFISHESYNTAAAKPTPQEKMRAIFSFLRSPGAKGKDALYEILKEDYKSLVSDLERSSRLRKQK